MFNHEDSRCVTSKTFGQFSTSCLLRRNAAQIKHHQVRVNVQVSFWISLCVRQLLKMNMIKSNGCTNGYRLCTRKLLKTPSRRGILANEQLVPACHFRLDMRVHFK